MNIVRRYHSKGYSYEKIKTHIENNHNVTMPIPMMEFIIQVKVEDLSAPKEPIQLPDWAEGFTTGVNWSEGIIKKVIQVKNEIRFVAHYRLIDKGQLLHAINSLYQVLYSILAL